jgi:hypothetical protein
MYTLGYVACWIVTSIVLVLAGREFHSRTGIAVLAGAIWPLVILGVAQMAIIALVAEITRRWAIRRAAMSEQEIDELVDMLLDKVEAGVHC